MTTSQNIRYMAKKIKFNLRCDGYPVSTIEELQEHFALEDVLNYYYGVDKLLLRWLDLRGYEDELFKVMAITAVEPKDVIKELAKIFGVEYEEEDIDSYFRSDAYRKERDKKDNSIRINDLKFHAIIENYRNRYEHFMNDLKSDNQKVRGGAINCLITNYKVAFEFGLPTMIENLKSENNVNAIIDIISLLSNSSDVSYLIIDSSNKVKFDLCSWLDSNAKSCQYKHFNLRKNDWEIIEDEDKRCLVIHTDHSYTPFSSVNKNKRLELGMISYGLKAKGYYDEIRYFIL